MLPCTLASVCTGTLEKVEMIRSGRLQRAIHSIFLESNEPASSQKKFEKLIISFAKEDRLLSNQGVLPFLWGLMLGCTL